MRLMSFLKIGGGSGRSSGVSSCCCCGASKCDDVQSEPAAVARAISAEIASKFCWARSRRKASEQTNGPAIQPPAESVGQSVQLVALAKLAQPASRRGAAAAAAAAAAASW